MDNEELLTNKELREKLKDKVEVLNKVKSLLLLSGTNIALTEQVANYYEVEKKTIQKIVERNRNELSEDGIKVLKYTDIKAMVNTDKVSVLKIPPRGSIIFPIRAILRVGMLLRDSKVAKEIRSQLLNIVENTSDDTKVKEIDREKDLIFNVVIAKDESARMLALNSYHSYMNKYKKYVDDVLDSKSGITTTKIAKTLGFRSANQLNKLLSDKHIQYKDGSGQWLLYSDYADKGFMTIHTHLDSAGNTHKTSKWTEKGEKFIYELIQNK